MTAHTAASYNHHKRTAQLVEALGGEEDAVAGELLEYELVVKVAGLCAPRERFGADVFLVRSGNGTETCELDTTRQRAGHC